MGKSSSSQSLKCNKRSIDALPTDSNVLKISEEKPKRSRSLRASLGWNSFDSTKSKEFTSRDDDDDDDDDEDEVVESKKNKNDPLFRSVN